MFIQLLVLFLILSAAILYTAHHIKRFRTIERKTAYTSALHITYILAAALMWSTPLLYGFAEFNTTISNNISSLQRLLAIPAIIILVLAICLYLLDKRAQRPSK